MQFSKGMIKVWLGEGVTEDSSLKLSQAKPKLYALSICALLFTGVSVENKRQDPTPMIYGGNKPSLPSVSVSMLSFLVTCLLPKTKAIRAKNRENYQFG